MQNGKIEVNGIDLYYEIYGNGDPLIMLHGGGSTIQSSFGQIIPALSKQFKVIAIELQNHGRSGFRDVPQTFEQDAEDVFGLTEKLGIAKAHFIGFSNGGTTVLQIAMKFPDKVNKAIVIAGAYKRNGFIEGFFEGMSLATLENMPPGLQKAFFEVNGDPGKLQKMFEKDRDRMIAFRDVNDADISSIRSPILFINGDRDVVTVEHTVEMFRRVESARLCIVPGEHGKYIGEVTTLGSGENHIDFVLSVISDFLNRS